MRQAVTIKLPASAETPLQANHTILTALSSMKDKAVIVDGTNLQSYTEQYLRNLAVQLVRQKISSLSCLQMDETAQKSLRHHMRKADVERTIQYFVLKIED